MSLILKLIAVLVGLVLMFSVLKTMKAKKMSAAQSIPWFLAAVLIIFLGTFPGLVGVFADYLGIWWHPAVLLFASVVILAFIGYSHTKELSVMRSQLTELSEQVAVLKHELRKKEIIHEGIREVDIDDIRED